MNPSTPMTLPMTDRSEDWIKRRSWGLVGVATLEQLRTEVGHGRAAEAHEVALWLGHEAAKAMPDDLFAATVAWVTSEGLERLLPLWARKRAAAATQPAGVSHASLGRGRTAAEWDETLHPRGEHGKFGHKDGGELLRLELPRFEGSVYEPAQRIADGKAAYLADHGFEPSATDFASVMVDPAMQRELADAYDALPLSDLAAFPAYDQLSAQVEEQYDYLTKDLGVDVRYVDHDPYRDAGEMVTDLRENNVLQVLRTSATGSHAYLTDDVNDKFRAVHDAFGHAAIGRGFDRNGEEAAFQSHAEMFRGDAVRALAMETRGQNAELIVRGEFPPQKVGLLPEGLELVSANRVLEPAAMAAATGADADNLYDVGHVHHVSIGRRLDDGRPPARLGRGAAASPRRKRSIDKGAVGPRSHPEIERAQRALYRLSALRRDTGRQLLAGAEIAFAEALRHAGVRAVTKARNRSGATLQRTVATAWESHQSMVPFFAALGMNEAELLKGSFGSYEAQAKAWLEQRRKAEAAALREQYGDDENWDDELPGDETTVGAAVLFLGAALLALARTRILSGQDPVDLSGPGEVSGSIPAQLAAQTLRIADGMAVAPVSANPDVVPTVTPIPDATGLEDLVASRLRATLSDELHLELAPGERHEAADLLAGNGIEYVWTHGFYGEPKTLFVPHFELDGTPTTEPDTDPAFANLDDWPEGHFFYPGDHLGCTCELVPRVAYGSDELLSVLDAARERVGPDAEAPLASENLAQMAAAEWDETLHPRGHGGKFAGKGGEAEPSGRVRMNYSARSKGKENNDRLTAAGERIAAAFPNAKVILDSSTDAGMVAEAADRIERFATEMPGIAGFPEVVTWSPLGIRYNSQGQVYLEGAGIGGANGWTLQFNSDWFEDPQKLRDSNEQMADEGWHPSATTYSTVDHELGHILDMATRADGRRQDDFSPEVRAQVSGYAASITDNEFSATQESFAEAFAARFADSNRDAWTAMPEPVRAEVERAMEMAR